MIKQYDPFDPESQHDFRFHLRDSSSRESGAGSIIVIHHSENLFLDETGNSSAKNVLKSGIQEFFSGYGQKLRITAKTDK